MVHVQISFDIIIHSFNSNDSVVNVYHPPLSIGTVKYCCGKWTWYCNMHSRLNPNEFGKTINLILIMNLFVKLAYFNCSKPEMCFSVA